MGLGRRRVCWALASGIFLLLAVLYGIAMWRIYSTQQTDVGSDYAYASWRMSRGAMLYRDVLGQQTPLLYVLGAVVYRVWSRPDAFLAIALAVRIITVVGVWLLARASGFGAVFAAVAVIMYMLLPMGFLFDVRFEPNILITCGGVLCTLTLTRLSSRRALLAGAGCAVFVLAKLTFAPLALALGAYLLFTRRSLARPFILAAVGTLLTATLVGYGVIGPAYIDGAYLAHAGSTLSAPNFVMSLRYVCNVEGMTALAALAGALLALRQKGPRRLLAFYLVGGLMTLGATISAGSLAPEMLAAEPAIALCAALAVRDALLAWRQGRTARPVYARVAPFMVAVLVAGQFLEARDDMQAVASARPSLGLNCAARLLERAASTGLPVIAPPYAAFLAQRRLVVGLSDTFNWTIRVRRGDSVARAQVGVVVDLLRHRRVSVVMMDDDHPLPPRVTAAIGAYYTLEPSCPGLRVFRPTATS